jgi:hypothetical protein
MGGWCGWWLVSDFVSDDAVVPRGRATTWDGFEKRMAVLFQTEEESYRRFRPRPSDVIISPFAKCGTTWLQQIVHSLRTGGDMVSTICMRWCRSLI